MDYLILITCECGNDEYFSLDNLPGGPEHCPFCSECGRRLTLRPPELATDGVVVDNEITLTVAADGGRVLRGD